MHLIRKLGEVSMRTLNRAGKHRPLHGSRSYAGEFCASREEHDSGQALAEMALVIPALLLLVLGLIEFGSAWRSYQVVTNAAREGARRAVMPDSVLVDSSEAAVLAIVEDVMTSGRLDYDPSYVTFSCDGVDGALCDGVRGASEEVRIDYPYEFIFIGPLADWACVNCGSYSFGTITLSASSVMRSEG